MIAALLDVETISPPGFFVDVGAHHPFYLSNTFLFYRLGWTGINIDAMPGSMKKFQALRPRDINLEIAISDHSNALTFYEFDHESMNGFVENIAAFAAEHPQIRVLNKHTIQTCPLKEVLAKHLPPGQPIDFLSVDVEGLDLQVLQSNDWTRFRPAVVVAEDVEAADLAGIARSRISDYMRDQSYIPVSRLRLSTAFVDARLLSLDIFGVRVKTRSLSNAPALQPETAQ
jgi:FkbM family methyltransferase